MILLSALLSSCASQGTVFDLSQRAAVDLEDTPFFAQKDYQCGPAALATLLSASGTKVTPEELTPMVYTPGREGSLQIDVVAAARRYARVPYLIDPEVDHVLDELDAGRPVLVLQNLGFSFRPVWHYAVAMGYDPGVGEIYLRSGTERRKAMRLRKFEHTWRQAGAWALVVLRPGEMPASTDRGRLLEATVAMETIQDPNLMVSLYRAYLEKFSDDPIARLGLANAHLNKGELHQAIALYRQLLNLDQSNVAAGNNLAIALNRANCTSSAAAQAQATAAIARDTNSFEVESKRTLEQLAIDTPDAVENMPYSSMCN